MSMIGNFGLCSEECFNRLVHLVKNNPSSKVEALIKNIYDGFEDSVDELEESKCSGEVFVAVFDYFQSELGIKIWKDGDFKRVSEFWRNIIGGYDMVFFAEKEKIQLLSLEDTIDYRAVIQYVIDFFACDYGDTGQIACKVLFENLKKLKEGNVLIWYLI